MKTLFIITGTSKGLGNAFFEVLNKDDNIIITINRNQIYYSNNHNINIVMDLSKITSNNLEEFETILSKKLLKNIKEVIFINNAFTIGKLSRIAELKNKDVVDAINTNFISSFLLIKSFINITKSLIVKKKIINISSGAAHKSIDGWSLYCSTKSAMEIFINSINIEYSNFFCVNIDPGVMNTEMQTNIRNFKDGVNNEYFLNLYINNELKDTLEVANKILIEYTK
jgi:benzil reductase ((S)-benzoin forming)